MERWIKKGERGCGKGKVRRINKRKEIKGHARGKRGEEVKKKEKALIEMNAGD